MLGLWLPLQISTVYAYRLYIFSVSITFPKTPYCSRNWDGWLCWDDTPAGTLASQNCPDYFSDLNPTGKRNQFHSPTNLLMSAHVF
uniref:G-protein coupled receptors family 2 profile 1 domain-containing protein n=1 Tax=Xiphophorus couchianus TaxID=32473 RepID=A0A3B5KNX0_9TELE